MNLTKEQLNQIKKFAEKYQINTVYLFGSQARGDITPMSDFDFAVQFNSDIKPADYFDLKILIISELIKIIKNDKVDVIVLNDKKTPIVLRFRAIKDGKKIYVNDEIIRSRLEHKIMSKYFDRKYYIERFTKISLNNMAEQGIL